MSQSSSPLVNQLVVKLANPYFASLTLGLGFTGYFFFGNLTMKTQGPLLLSRTQRAPTVGETLDAWAWTFHKGKVSILSS